MYCPADLIIERAVSYVTVTHLSGTCDSGRNEWVENRTKGLFSVWKTLRL